MSLEPTPLENRVNSSDGAKRQLQKLQMSIGQHQCPLRQTELLNYRNSRARVVGQLLKGCLASMRARILPPDSTFFFFKKKKDMEALVHNSRATKSETVDL